MGGIIRLGGGKVEGGNPEAVMREKSDRKSEGRIAMTARRERGGVSEEERE